MERRGKNVYKRHTFDIYKQGREIPPAQPLEKFLCKNFVYIFLFRLLFALEKCSRNEYTYSPGWERSVAVWTLLENIQMEKTLICKNERNPRQGGNAGCLISLISVRNEFYSFAHDEEDGSLTGTWFTLESRKGKYRSKENDVSSFLSKEEIWRWKFSFFIYSSTRERT